MSKKSRENSSRTPAGKMERTATKAPVKKAAKVVAKNATTAATKSAVKKAVAKPAKPTVKTAKKVVAKTVKAAPAPKPAKPPVATPAVAKKIAATITKPVTEPPAATKPVKAKTAAPAVAVEGAMAPAFSLPRDGGATVSLADYAGQQLVIFFYPRANTPGCTKEAIDFTRLTRDFGAAKTAVLGVSADPLKAQESFRDKHDLTTPLLSDEAHAMLKAYGAWGEKSMYGKTFEGVLRTTVLIDKGGRVAKIWRGVKVDGHADAVLEEASRI
jgi:thioredoxin-dependent peroxiredoxin